MLDNKGVLAERFKPVALLYLTGIVVNFITRLMLLFVSFNELSFSIKNIAGIFFIGLFYDICFLSFVSIPFVLIAWLTNDLLFKAPWKKGVIVLFIAGIILSVFRNPIPSEFDKKLPWVFTGLLVLLFGIYLLLASKTDAYRHRWRIRGMKVFFFIILFLLVFNIISEYFFWDEFGSRYNFIAVDYLIYTNEVVGNIRESYPIGWIIAGVLLVTVLVFLVVKKHLAAWAFSRPGFAKRSVLALGLLVVPALVYLLVNNRIKNFSDNDYVNQLAGNGVYEFGAAFWNNDLDFYRFYKTIPDTDALAEVRKQLLERSPTDSFFNNDGFSVERMVNYTGPEKRMNVVLISIESFSASFMGVFGNTQKITPYLDSLSRQSIFFSQCYATGTRTVRGLEVLSLSIPPIPGQSIVRRPHNDSLFTIGAVLRERGYTTQFLYGGYSSFDNMGPYFSANGYEVIDRSALKQEEIHYANIWGVADEDMFTLALKQFDKNAATGKPFFAQIMTVSNHRPYTYPEGRIDISPKLQKREGAVKYTDYCIGNFLKQAAAKPWFSNTVFVIVADHCASAAGKTDLPVTGYHIPLFIYSPANLQPQTVDHMVSQMDVVPTILGLLNKSYRSKFFGQDLLRMPPGKDRAFISTYSGLGYLRDSQLVVQTPPHKVEQQRPDFSTGTAVKMAVNDSLYRQALSYYQLAEKIFKSGGYKK
ncbi:LTA synthase family protein [Niabella aurantiaca]|uniref:LTA synthase family protein n=1 Tax=Niabella aurantiaca TaxID=379900 RepID=UPI00037A15E2|nr:LTA synthase family protein [Niabella aurantiaca]